MKPTPIIEPLTSKPNAESRCPYCKAIGKFTTAIDLTLYDGHILQFTADINDTIGQPDSHQPIRIWCECGHYFKIDRSLARYIMLTAPESVYTP